MISLYDGKISDVMPPLLASDILNICLAYALHEEVKRLIRLANATRLHSMIEDLDELTLDILAIELRSPYYVETMDIETKRLIVKKTLIWHQKAGTPSAVNELIQIAFGNGHVVEWFNYAPDDPPFTPGTFDIVTEAQLTVNAIDYFNQIIHRVKNTRSHLRRIVKKLEMHKDIFVGIGVLSSPSNLIISFIESEQKINSNLNVGIAVMSSPVSTICSKVDKNKQINLNYMIGIGVISTPKVIIDNHYYKNLKLKLDIKIGTALRMHKKIIIKEERQNGRI